MGERSNSGVSGLLRSLSLKRRGNTSNTGQNHNRHALPDGGGRPAAAVDAAAPSREISADSLASLGYSSLNYVPPPVETRPRRNTSTKHRRAQQSYDMLGGHAPPPRGQARGQQLPLRASRSDESLAIDIPEPPRLQSTARGAPSGPPPYGSSPPITSPYLVKSPKPLVESEAPASSTSVGADPLQNVKDHMRANADLIGNGPFFSVQRGWKKGIYMSRAEADRQIKNFPGPVIKTFENLDEAIAFLQSHADGSETKDEDQDEEVLERARIFSDLASSGQVELKRAISLSSERKAARSRAAKARNGSAETAKTTVASHEAAASPPMPALSPGCWQAVGKQPLRSPFTDYVANPLDQTPASTAEAMPGPSRIATLLPVRNLELSRSFYVDVLGLTCKAHYEGAQALLVTPSGGAAICLRSLDVAPPAPSGSSLGRSSSLNRSDSVNGKTSRPPLPPMNEDGEPSPFANSAPDSPSRPDRRFSRSPVPPPPPPRSASAQMSGVTAILELTEPLNTLHALVSRRVSAWLQRDGRSPQLQGSRRTEGAKVLSGIEDRPWGCQEFSVSDPDGHRLIFSSPLQAL